MSSYQLFDTPYECPYCGILVQYEFECPGYGQNPVMVCVPPCGGAIEFTCPICDWWFRHPNNRDTTKMGRRPEWIAQALKDYFFQPETWDEEEDPLLAWPQEYISLDREDELPHSCDPDCEYCNHE